MSKSIKFELLIRVNNPRSYIFLDQDIESSKSCESNTPTCCHMRKGFLTAD